MKVALVSLGEAGNFGDDLILIAVLSSIGSIAPDAEVEFVSFGQSIPLEALDNRPELALPRLLRRRPARRFLPVLAERHRHFKDPDIILIGGGGLLETSHHPLRPHHWLGYVPRTNVPVVGVGIGIGPLSEKWEAFFRRNGSPFSRLYVRDEQSRDLGMSYGWEVEECEDFIDQEFLARFTAAATDAAVTSQQSNENKVPTLGVALRQWPGLSVDRVAQHIEAVADHHQSEHIRFFVLETNNGTGTDVAFTRDVASRLQAGRPIEHFEYRSSNLLEFTNALSGVDVAISMKLHSSAIWAHQGVSIYPIIYAPKIASFFGIPYRGLEILQQPHRAAIDAHRLPAREAVIRCLGSQQKDLSAPSFKFGRVQNSMLHSWSTLINLRSAVATRVGMEGK